MTKLIVLSNNKLCPMGCLLKINSYKESLCDILINNNILIDHFCEKFGKCITCSVIIKEGYIFLNKINYEEFENLNKKLNFIKNIRLSCQTFIEKKRNIIIKINA